MSDFWVGRKILAIDQTSPVDIKKYLKDTEWDTFTSKVIGFTVLKVHRIAKNIILVMSSGCMWHIHLNSTGWFRQSVKSETQAGDPESDRNFLHSTADSTCRLEVSLSDGQKWKFLDPRTWASFFLRKGIVPLKDPYLASFGPDWLNEPEAASIALLSHRGNRTVKDVLCDQKITSGIGNYLACEACFLALIHPHSRWKSISPQSISYLIAMVQKVVHEAMVSQNSDHWRVFKRADKPCPNSNILDQHEHTIQYVKDAGGQRGTYFCPRCQGDPTGVLPKRPGPIPEDF